MSEKTLGTPANKEIMLDWYKTLPSAVCGLLSVMFGFLIPTSGGSCMITTCTNIIASSVCSFWKKVILLQGSLLHIGVYRCTFPRFLSTVLFTDEATVMW